MSPVSGLGLGCVLSPALARPERVGHVPRVSASDMGNFWRVRFIDDNFEETVYPKTDLMNANEDGIRLPGSPKLGEGKPENQNHAIIFSRGECLQTIDMNQHEHSEIKSMMKNNSGKKYKKMLTMKPNE
ncbi:Callose synthase 10 [Acorus calamus]|uniref:Callose synthase 10 n=1 Tax=Acorus calamus TaxID=4465 RepID=A0AAV9FGX2_ACOCL|nr:Callose synthase 10 [Acorus calamus]